ncbi:MAG: 50S ribosomal protein L44, partial [Candidatus Bathyarchaeia archaeon]
GGQKFPEQRKHAKTTKKQVILLSCVKCGYTLHRLGVRLSKLEVKH